MEHDGYGEHETGKHDATIENEQDGPENQGRRDGSGMEILVEYVKRGARNRHRKEYADEGDAGPLSTRTGKAATGEGKAAPEQEKCRQALARQLGDGDRDVSKADPGSHKAIEDTGLHLQSEELEIVGIKRGMEAVLDRGEVDRIIFHSGVVSFHEQRPSAYQCQ
jgi:hypothetical protein